MTHIFNDAEPVFVGVKNIMMGSSPSGHLVNAHTRDYRLHFSFSSCIKLQRLASMSLTRRDL